MSFHKKEKYPYVVDSVSLGALSSSSPSSWTASFFRNSAIDGLPKIADRSKPLGLRVMWAFVCLGALVVTVVQLATLIRRYFDYPVNVHIDYNFSKTLDFPSVTICNLNSVRNSMIRNTRFELLENDGPTLATFTGFVRESSDDGGSGKLNSSSSSEGSADDVVDFEDDQGNVDAADRLGPQYLDIYEKFLLALDTVFSAKYVSEKAITNNLKYLHPTFEEYRLLGHQLDDFLLECTWKGQPCNRSHFVTFQNHKYGNCFTFNSGRDSQHKKLPILRTSRPGAEYGLQLSLYLEQEEYIGTVSSKAGVRLLVHSQQSVPFPEEEGVDVAPGFASSVGVKLVEVIRLQHPWGNCSSGNGLTSIYDDLHGPMEYSAVVCYKSCLAKAVKERCGCTAYEFPLNGRVCESKAVNETEGQCVDDVYEMYRLEKFSCNCPQACVDRMYSTTVSASTWPSVNHEAIFRERMERLNKSITKKSGTAFENNFARISVYYEELNYQRIAQTKAYESSQLLSDIGGQMGLWLGLSIVSLSELLEFIALAIANLTKREKREETTATTPAGII
ncbi:amiloride-sensitive sodium channel subunit gamma-like isoform X2 [Oscarella lobularis]|uniref:amiloride-sensitive sodium channel subunit gamma-like isoform X2 n=1 Tax=Oscarella lobularis TaxID=121494 RepID=UPI003313FB09